MPLIGCSVLHPLSISLSVDVVMLMLLTCSFTNAKRSSKESLVDDTTEVEMIVNRTWGRSCTHQNICYMYEMCLIAFFELAEIIK